MSHNTPKIGTATQDRVGDLDTSITDLNDVSGSPSNDQALVYSSASSAFIPTVNSRLATEYIFIGRGESNAYTNTGQTGTATPAVGDVWYYYDTSPRESITGASITKVGTTDWIESITLPAGQYTIFSQHHAVFVASGYLAVRWYDGATPVSGRGMIGENLSLYGGSASNSMGWLNLASSTTISCKIDLESNVDTITNQGNTPSEFGYVLIRKVQ
jgi:hypothetical protein